ncbi:12743_t:CDS:2, partial [Dentiscutata heterogama]
MQKSNTLTHDDPAGDLGTRFSQHGYGFSSAGENVAQGYNDEESVMQGWMNSPGHRENILNPSFKDAGFAQAGSFWTQDFDSHSSKASATNPKHGGSPPPSSQTHGGSPPSQKNSDSSSSYKKIVHVVSQPKPQPKPNSP